MLLLVLLPCASILLLLSTHSRYRNVPNPSSLSGSGNNGFGGHQDSGNIGSGNNGFGGHDRGNIGSGNNGFGGHQDSGNIGSGNNGFGGHDRGNKVAELGPSPSLVPDDDQ